MKIVPLADAKARLSAYVDECMSKGPVIITRNGRPVAVLLAPIDEDDLDRLMMARSPKFQALLAKSRGSIVAGKGLAPDEFWKAVKTSARAKSNGAK
jgi:prevent-host-death family protein